MARKRGGLAGLWDRNKKIIKPIATIGAGLLTGGAGGALVGGLMNGLDREGKGGIGFDAGKGVRGAIGGYAMGAGAGALKSGIMSRLGGKAASQLMANNPMGVAAIQNAGSGIGSAASAANAAAQSAGGGMLGRIGSAAGGLMKNGAALKAAGDTIVGGYGAMQQNRALQMQEAEQRRREELEMADRSRNEAMDPVRAQLLQLLMQRMGGGAGMSA